MAMVRPAGGGDGIVTTTAQRRKCAADPREGCAVTTNLIELAGTDEVRRHGASPAGVRRAFSALCGCRYNPVTTSSGAHHGHRRLLGQWQSLRVARAVGARVQAAAVPEPPAAVLEAGAQIPADARTQSARPRAGPEGRGLRLLRVARDPVLPGPQV